MENNTPEKYDPVTFAQSLRASYPGAFDSVKDDYALAQGFIAEHPEASDHVDFGPQHPMNPNQVPEEGANPTQPFGTLQDLKSHLQEEGAKEKEIFKNSPGKGEYMPSMGGLAATQVPTTPGEITALGAAGPAGGLLGDLGKAAATSKIGKSVLQAAYKMGPNVYPKVSKYVLDNWQRVMSSPSVENATDNYIASAGKSSLKHVDESIADRFGELVDPSKHYDTLAQEGKTAANQYLTTKKVGAPTDLRLSESEPFTPQHALDSIQALNFQERSIPLNVKEKTLRAKQLQGVSKAKNALYDYLEETGSPQMREAALKLKDAYHKETVTSLFPKNINGDANVLRPYLTALTKGALAPITSPALFTGGLRSIAAGNSALQKGGGLGLEMLYKAGTNQAEEK